MFGAKLAGNAHAADMCGCAPFNQREADKPAKRIRVEAPRARYFSTPSSWQATGIRKWRSYPQWEHLKLSSNLGL
jgi:hypothetical protein